jgi:[protein-PII] uridylyltransferase
VIDLAGEPPLTAALPVALEAAVLCDQHRPGSRLLDWLSGLPDAPLRWDSRARAAFFVLLERGGPRAWRFLSLTGVLDRALPELGAVLARRQADPFELDATGALRWPRLARVLELQGRAQLEHPERVALAAVILDATEDEPPDQTVVIARRLIGRLGLGAAVEQSVAGLVTDAGLLAAAARRIDAFSEEKVLALAVHLGNSEQARALYLLTVASGTADDPIDQRRVAELHQLVQAALARPELTGREASNAVSQRQAEAIRLVRDEAVKERITAAPRAYVLATPPDAIARHAALCEPLPRSDEVRVAVAPPPGGATVEVVARDRVGLLARVAGVLAGRGLDIRAATIATWGDGCALASLGVDGEPPSGTDLAAAITTALHHPPVPHPFPHVQLTFDDQGSPWHTLCRAEGPDRPGLLHALTAAFAVAGASVHAARIGSVGGVATDEFELTDRHGHKLTPATEAAIRAALERGATPRRAWYAPWRPSRPARNGAATSAFTKTKQTSDKRATTEP